MTLFSQAHFQLLKLAVLRAAGIDFIRPTDCQILSFKISVVTGRPISDTTLKRVYGFAQSKFDPSQYTLDLMARYCGYAGWKDFCEKRKVSEPSPLKRNKDWEHMRNEAMKITEFTLTVLKNKAGIPFGQTIERKFFEDRMYELMTSDSIGTLFAAPAGYGKSISACHWVEQQLQLSYVKYTEDIILFFSGHALMSTLLAGKQLVDWLLALLGYSAETGIKALTDLAPDRDHKFYLIIDAFDPHLLRGDRFELLVEQLNDILSLHRSSSFFKLVLTMRTATWLNYRQHWEDEVPVWLGLPADTEQNINVPMFTGKEIAGLRSKRNPTDDSPVTPAVLQVIGRPLHFQHFYKLHNRDLNLKLIDSVTLYELLSARLATKVYGSATAAEKLAFLMRVIDNMDLANDNHQVDKLKLEAVLRQNTNIYQEFLSVGLLNEINCSTNYYYDDHVEFADPNILDHFISKKLLHSSHGRLDNALVDNVNTLLKISQHKLPVIKWCVLDISRTGHPDDLNYITQFELSVTEKADMVNFIGDLLKREVNGPEDNTTLLTYLKDEHNARQFDQFFEPEKANKGYKTILQTLLNLDLLYRQKVLIHISLALIALSQLDLPWWDV